MERSRSCSGNVPSNGSVKIGGLWKRSQGLSRFTRPNYRHRVFILTDQALSYYSGTVDRVGQMKGRVALDTITAVEFVEESAFNLPHTFQVVYQSRKCGFVMLYVTARDNVEVSDWVATLRKACYLNKEMMMHFHPGALFRNRWSCCQQQGRTSLGCQPTYHLLTRSSSRYAQMRRKDTLSSSYSSGRRRSKSGSVPREEQVSGPPDSLQVPADDPSSGRGLSNSCFDLTHKQIHNQFEAPETESQTESQRCSQHSTEPSISMGCITLTHLSLHETAMPPSPFLPPVDPVTNTDTQRSPLLQGKNRRSRVQVAPENAADVTPKSFPSSESQPHLTYTSPYPVPPNRFTHSVSAQFPTITLTNSPAHVKEYQYLTVPRNSRRVKTYLGTVSPSVWQNQLSNSLNALPAKPVLEPKISVTDPNTIHV